MRQIISKPPLFNSDDDDDDNKVVHVRGKTEVTNFENFN